MAAITCSDGLHLSVEDIIRRDAVINDDGTITIVSAARTIKIHRTTADTTPTASAWTDCSTFTEIATETQGSIAELNADNKTIDILQSGFYSFGGCVHYQNNSGGDKNALVASRLYANGTTEVRCSQRAQKMTVKTGGESVLSYNGTVYLSAGDSVVLQYYLSDNTIDFTSNAVFTNPIAYTLWLTNIGN